MVDFFPWIHKRNEKKETELEPLYIEAIPPPPPERKKDKEDEPRVIIIRL